MKKHILVSGIVLGAAMLPMLAQAAAKPDRVGGTAKADFAASELTIPCVLVEGLDDDTDGLYFDIVLKRRGNSFNYELAAAAAEDTEMREAIAAFAELEDEDYVDDDAEGDDTGEDEEAGDDTTTP